ncbi:unnamed protein product [Nippostrongylus brasiliensis]|uniref:Plasma membrane proteolipid 3 n=1 Tax=Nippostrongylus brasiliensis TaxID=27835 RepID=A0A0N4YDG1_NIPBR|nr:unnamed protein product [Nippostrongylus brasiliensis]
MCKCCEFLLAFVFPPLAVLSHTGCSGALLFNVVLTSCLWIPGIAHAIYVVCQPEEPQIVLTTNVSAVV